MLLNEELAAFLGPDPDDECRKQVALLGFTLGILGFDPTSSDPLGTLEAESTWAYRVGEFYDAGFALKPAPVVVDALAAAFDAGIVPPFYKAMNVDQQVRTLTRNLVKIVQAVRAHGKHEHAKSGFLRLQCQWLARARDIAIFLATRAAAIETSRQAAQHFLDLMQFICGNAQGSGSNTSEPTGRAPKASTRKRWVYSDACAVDPRDVLSLDHAYEANAGPVLETALGFMNIETTADGKQKFEFDARLTDLILDAARLGAPGVEGFKLARWANHKRLLVQEAGCDLFNAQIAQKKLTETQAPIARKNLFRRGFWRAATWYMERMLERAEDVDVPTSQRLGSAVAVAGITLAYPRLRTFVRDALLELSASHEFGPVAGFLEEAADGFVQAPAPALRSAVRRLRGPTAETEEPQASRLETEVSPGRQPTLSALAQRVANETERDPSATKADIARRIGINRRRLRKGSKLGESYRRGRELGAHKLGDLFRHRVRRQLGGDSLRQVQADDH